MKKITILIMIAFLSITLQAKDILKTYNFKDSKNKSIELQTMNNGVYFPNYKGKVVLLAFFGRYCPPCLAEIPELVKIQKEYSKNFQIVAMHVQQKMTKQELTNFVTSHNMNYTVIPSSNKVFDFANFITQKTGWGGQIPYSILFDKEGNAVKTYLGMQPEASIAKDIKSLF
ncbi:MAG: TlpA disulfide reductase family protein [Sulfurospirillaceae bacterium]|nr:TlpA disulfide reductase family protein [Sulfurospirillaceae bacterium]